MNKYSRLPDRWYVKIREDEHGTKGREVVRIVNEIGDSTWLTGGNGIFTVIDGKSNVWGINSGKVFVGVELTVDEVLSLVEVKQNPKPEVQVGDIGVRIRIRSSTAGEKGGMLRAQYRDNDYWDKHYLKGGFPYKDDYSVSKDNWRYATDKEIEAYSNGIRNINDIPEDKPVMNTYVFKVGDHLDTDIINAWKNAGINYIGGSSRAWKWKDDSGNSSYVKIGS